MASITVPVQSVSAAVVASNAQVEVERLIGNLDVAQGDIGLYPETVNGIAPTSGQIITSAVPPGATVERVFVRWGGRYDFNDDTVDLDTGSGPVAVMATEELYDEVPGGAWNGQGIPWRTFIAEVSGTAGLTFGPGANTVDVSGFDNGLPTADPRFETRGYGVSVWIVYSDPTLQEVELIINNQNGFAFERSRVNSDRTVSGSSMEDHGEVTCSEISPSVQNRNLSFTQTFGAVDANPIKGTPRTHQLQLWSDPGIIATPFSGDDLGIAAGADVVIDNPVDTLEGDGVNDNGHWGFETYVNNTINVDAGDAYKCSQALSQGPTPDNDVNFHASIGIHGSTVRVETVYRVGNLVWIDSNDNGLADVGEPGVENMVIELWEAGGTAPLLTTTTDANGNYLFEGLIAGDYFVQIPGGQTGQLVNGAVVDVQTAYSESSFDDGMPDNDEDNDDNGVLTGIDLVSGVFTLGDTGADGDFSNNASDEPTDETDRVGGPDDDAADLTIAEGNYDDVRSNLSIDFGYVPPSFDLALIKTIDSGANLATVAPGDTVTFTIEVFNQGTEDATAVEIADYIPAGLTLADADWTESAGVATLNTPIAALAVGDSTTVDITFTVDAGADGTINNFAEISAALNGAGEPVEDIDSTPDPTPGDTGPETAGDPDDDNIDDSGKAGEDEDDHDVATLEVTSEPAIFDLALQKQMADGSNLGSVMPGDSVTFTITVINQGTVNAENVTVTDYLPATGLTLADPAWTDNGDGTADTSIAGPLAPGASTTVDITFTVDADATGQINNFAEISAADPTDGGGIILTDDTGAPLTDIDSVPDADPSDDNQPTGPNEPTDDTIDEDGLNGGDEDDHDVAGITIVTDETYSLGNQVWFDDNNNGMIDPGEAPIEAVWVELFTDNDGDGQPDDTNGDGVIDVNDAVATTGTDADGLYLFDGLAPGDYIVAIPPMEWDPGAPLDGFLSSGPTSVDPNDDVDNDDNGMTGPGGYIISGPVTIGDGEPTGEDPDNDPNTPDANENLTVDFGFYQPVFDMALFKQLADGSNLGTVAPGDEVTFTLSLVNQGTVDAADLTVVDYLPAGLTLADSDWTEQSDGTATTVVAGPITTGATFTVDITFTVNADATGVIDNWAEIASATPIDSTGQTLTMPNGVPIPDIDSVPDASNTDTYETNDAIDGNGIDGGDEDDHDLAQLTIVGVLAFTGGNAITLALVASTSVVAGVLALMLANRSRRRREDLAIV